MKVEFHSGELFPRVGFIVTNLELPSRAVVQFTLEAANAENPAARLHAVAVRRMNSAGPESIMEIPVETIIYH